MNIGLIGLGKMGYNLCLNMRDNDFKVIAYNRSQNKLEKILKEGVEVAYSLEELTKKLKPPRILWFMITSGPTLDHLIELLLPMLSPGDIVIDGGNSYYKDSVRRSKLLATENINFIDVGTSGGMFGARNGACMMIGGKKEAFKYLEPLFEAMCVEDGYAYLGYSGAGHYTKMIHNGIEYGMMQALGEGFQLLKASDYEFDLKDIAKVWSNGSIIEGLLVKLLINSFTESPGLEEIERFVDTSGEGEWTLIDAIEKKVSIPTITSALFARFKSKDTDYFSEKVIAALRNEFGGHKVYKKE